MIVIIELFDDLIPILTIVIILIAVFEQNNEIKMASKVEIRLTVLNDFRQAEKAQDMMNLRIGPLLEALKECNAWVFTKTLF